MYDRAMQVLYALALDQVPETAAGIKSFGLCKGRCAQDACEYIFTALSHSYSPQWVLEDDNKGCSNHISHDWLIEHIPMDKSVLKQFLKADFIFQNKLFPTDEGSPQGGVISSNALDFADKVCYTVKKNTGTKCAADDKNLTRVPREYMSKPDVQICYEKAGEKGRTGETVPLHWNVGEYVPRLCLKNGKMPSHIIFFRRGCVDFLAGRQFACEKSPNPAKNLL